MSELMRRAAKMVMGFGIFIVVLAVSKNITRADFIYYPEDEFAKEHVQDCVELQDAGVGGRTYTVSGEGVTSYVSPDSTEQVNTLKNGSSRRIYYLFKQPEADRIWGCLNTNEWVSMDKLSLKYDETCFMEEYSAYIRDTENDRYNSRFIPEVKGYDLEKIDKMYLYPGDKDYQSWEDWGQPDYIYSVIPTRVYTDEDGKLWGYVNSYNWGHIRGWYCISDLPRTAVMDYDDDGRLGLTDAYICLKAALGISDSRIPDDIGCEYTLDAVHKLLKYALKIRK